MASFLTSSEDARRRADRRTRRRDAIARRVIALGGVSVIFCVLLMLALIAATAMPLFRSVRVAVLADLVPDTGGRRILAAGASDDTTLLYTLDDSGTLSFFRAPELTDVVRRTLRQAPADVHIVAAETYGPRALTLAWSDGAATHAQVRFRTDHAAPGRPTVWSVALDELPAPNNLPPNIAHQFLRRTAEGFTRAALTADGALHVWRYDEEGAELATVASPPYGETVFTVAAGDEAGGNLYAGTATGRIVHWNLADPRSPPVTITAFADRRALTGLGVAFGDQALVVGDAAGGLTVWSQVARYGVEGEKRLTLIHDLGRQAAPVYALAFTRHDRSFLAVDRAGGVTLAHTTSARRLATLPGRMRHAAFGARGNVAVGHDDAGAVRLWHVRNPHPNVAPRTLFRRIFYEGYDRPTFVWQSSSANDDFEPKLSLVPLLFGSVKATVYALFFAVPLALFGALYTSQFTTPGVRALIKPLVELMSAVPSVVVGILAALWLAPRIASALVGTMLLVVAVPVTTVLFALVWAGMRRTRWARTIERGWEFTLAIPVLLAGVAVALAIGPWIERLLFAGDFAQWCFREIGVRVDQRNSVVIAFALGFAVIPIVFTISEDALSNVPRSLTAASLALGASRWQTVRRVVLPSASPGIFAAIIVGFGRAVGETMIVLMATGNTPVMDWRPFSGMRTLAANIAVEIPEAPIGGTLYRTLFLSAVLLFVLTAVLNTVAEVVRQRLRKRYGY